MSFSRLVLEARQTGRWPSQSRPHVATEKREGRPLFLMEAGPTFLILKKNAKSKIWALHALCIPKISNLAKNQLPGTIWHREHSIFVILRNRALKFSFCMETPMFSKIRNKFARERRKLFKFRKKRQILINQIFHMSQTCKNDPGPHPTPLTMESVQNDMKVSQII